MGKLLTEAEWKDVRPPLYWRKLTSDYQWGNIEFDIATKWVAENIEGWCYLEKPMFVFEHPHDAVIFEMWLQQDILDKNVGSI